MRWLILTGIVIVNLAGIYGALAPERASFAQVAPPELQCTGCASPDVQHALARAVALGRSQAAGVIRPQLITAVAAVNIAAVACLLWGLGVRPRRIAP
jgi:hypothetical protein